MVRVSGPRCAAPLGPLDPRTAAWREDLADIALAGRVAVSTYVEPVEMVAVRQVPMLAADRADAPATSELLPGERFAMLDSGHGFAWGYSVHDHYVGHIALDALAAPDAAPGARGRIGPGDGLLFAAPGVKAPVVGTLPAGACVRFEDEDDRFVRLAGPIGGGAFLHRRHLLDAGGTTADWASLAERYRGAPYRWGGRSRAGIDCSGLVQMARLLAGHACRRDSDMQAADAHAIEPADAQRGDIAWWPGHIGILLSPGELLHANAFRMETSIEPLADVAARAAAGGAGGTPRILRL